MMAMLLIVSVSVHAKDCVFYMYMLSSKHCLDQGWDQDQGQWVVVGGGDGAEKDGE